MNFPVSIKGVFVEAGRVVLLENDRDEWELPGGRLEPGEAPETCLAREFARNWVLWWSMFIADTQFFLVAALHTVGDDDNLAPRQNLVNLAVDDSRDERQCQALRLQLP